MKYQKYQIVENDNWQLQLEEILLKSGRKKVRHSTKCVWSKIVANPDSVT